MSQSATKIWSSIVIAHIFYLFILFIPPRFGYSFRGGFYTTLIIGLLLLFITAWFIRPHSKIDRECNQKRINILVGVVLLTIYTIFFQFFMLYTSGMGGASHPCIREYPSPNNRLVLNVSACVTMTFGYTYSISRNYGFIQKHEIYGVINSPISGKWLDDRFENLLIQWNEDETAIKWIIFDYKTTSGSMNNSYDENNPKQPIKGTIPVNIN